MTTSPEIESLFTEFHTFPTSDQYEEQLSCVSAEMSQPISSFSSDQPISEPSSSLRSSQTQFTDSDVLGRYCGEEEPALARDDLQQLLAASALITRLEAICSAGILPLAEEISTRELIVKAAKAFKFNTQAERGAQ